MEWLAFALVLGGGGGAGAYGAQRIRAARADRRTRAAELEGVRGLADEDVTVFGEQLQRLGVEVSGLDLDDDTRRDYQIALDAYERAKWDAPRLGDIEQISSLIDTLTTGRYALACVRARIAGGPVPELRVPCFFNPQHGPSIRQVMWTSARHGTRQVPACGLCAARVAAHEKPEVRMVRIGSRTVPYWEAGAAFEPYSRGYFPADAIGVASVAWMFADPEMGGGYGFGAGFDGHDSFNGGGFDGGGFDGGGGGGD